MSNQSKSFQKRSPHLTQAIVEIGRLSQAYQLLVRQMEEIALVQIKVTADTQEARSHMGDAVLAMKDVLEEFDARIARIEQHLGIETKRVLDNDGTTP